MKNQPRFREFFYPVCPTNAMWIRKLWKRGYNEKIAKELKDKREFKSFFILEKT